MTIREQTARAKRAPQRIRTPPVWTRVLKSGISTHLDAMAKNFKAESVIALTGEFYC